MKSKLLLVSLSLVLLLAGCNRSYEESLEKKLSRISSAAELGTVEYTVKKVVKLSDEKWSGDRKILYQCTAYIKGGIDMKNFDAKKDIEIDKGSKSVDITLPKAEILSFNMPVDKVVLVYEKSSGFRKNFNASERNDILKQGEESIRKDLPNFKIEEAAQQNAEEFFTSMFTGLGFKHINIKFR